MGTSKRGNGQSMVGVGKQGPTKGGGISQGNGKGKAQGRQGIDPTNEECAAFCCLDRGSKCREAHQD